MADARTNALVRPALTARQLQPPSALVKTPPPFVPAYTVVVVTGSIASARTVVLVSPVLTALQLPPPSALLKTPPPLAPPHTPIAPPRPTPTPNQNTFFT